MLNCPKCLGKLDEKVVEKVKIDVCWLCEGIWFDKNELEKVLKADAKDIKTKTRELDRKEFDGKEASDISFEYDKKTGKCPKCANETELERKNYENVIFADECPNCQGIWLDGGEIHRLRGCTLVKIYNKVCYFDEVFTYAASRIFNKEKFGEDEWGEGQA